MRTKLKPKPRYRLRNWPEYNTALRSRGSLTLWLDEAVTFWIDPESQTHHTRHGGPPGRPHRGHPCVYSETAITCMLVIRAVFHLPLRAAVGFVEWALQAKGYKDLRVADPSTLSRRAATIEVRLPTSHRDGEPLNLVVDSTGLKVYGEGEWKTKKHGWTRHRTWRKLHIGIDADTLDIRVLEVSAPEVGDSQMLPQLLAAEHFPIAQATGDGSYDSRACYETVASRPEHPLAVFPPRRERRRGQPLRPDRGHPRPAMRRTNRSYSLHTWQHGNCKAPPLDRDQHVRRIRRIGRRRWKEEVGYNSRSLVETEISRLKGIFGSAISSHKPATQLTEVRIRAAALNQMTSLGMPDSYLVHAH
jgi:hypothetical protein